MFSFVVLAAAAVVAPMSHWADPVGRVDPGGRSAAATYNGREGAIAVKIPRLQDAGVTIDGNLNEPEWGQAAALTGFSEYAPTDGRAADDSTEVLVWYSPTAIYFGVRAFEAHGGVHAVLANRDNIDADDNVQILLNTFHDGRRALVFAANPLGVQEDGTMVEGNGLAPNTGLNITNRPPTDLSPDYVYESKGRITATGYEIEIRIPFKTLKFPAADPQDWGLNIVRIVQHSGHVDTWAPVTRTASSFLGQSGSLVGLTELHRQLVLDVNPIVTEKSIGGPRAPTGWSYSVQHPEFGGNVRYGLTSNLTLNGTINPDFAEVEADAAQLVFDPRNALFFTEKRPFFLDGLEQFTTPNTLIYTRRIVEPVAAAKLAGTVAGTSVAYLGAVDDKSTSATGLDNPVYNILRVQHNLGAESKLGLALTDKEDDGSFNRLGGVDAHLPFAKVYSLDLQAAESSSRDSGRTVNGPLWQAHLFRTARTYGFDYVLAGVDPAFQAASGFISRSGIVQNSLVNHVTLYGSPHTLLESVTGVVQLAGTWQYDNFVHGRSIEDRFLHFSGVATLHGGWQIAPAIYFETFGYDSTLFTNYYIGHPAGHDTTYTRFVGTPRIPNTDYVVQVVTPQFSQFSGSVFSLWGRDENFFEWSAADIAFLTLTADWRPTTKLRLSGTYNLQQYHRHSNGSTVGIRRIPRLDLEYQLSRPIFLRLIGQYDANFQDNLFDDSRTGLPLFIFDPATNTYARAAGFTDNNIQISWLFSYQPLPGTVFFAGYGNTATEPLSFHLTELRRTADNFFIKFSYLFRF